MNKLAEDRAAERCQELAPARNQASQVSQRDWLHDILRILSTRPLGLHIEQLEAMLWEMRFPRLPMPARFRVQVHVVLSRYSSQSVVFRQRKGRVSDDLFYSPEGKGSGSWAVHRGKAEAWLDRRAAPARRPTALPSDPQPRGGAGLTS